ncbi:methylated-DNA--[protein]-cysteine S-methyltransferase [Microbacterium sp. Marseille-Q6965]|uniref:methylated-DNA--[protein]-cysteine S-methyltransferase n=1 Tax=Microbacterium sp. Marseille-Q6965 TaxID=2965072 RepID=UPI0021B82697|nr:methylated-DNA--[protein]-cysteine S-methyltransferase [Microbacterium sp. Marseille-Q6965]
MEFRFGTVDCPLGVVVAVASAEGLIAVRVADDPGHALGALAHQHRISPEPDEGVVADLAPQLAAYFDGRLRTFDVPLDWRLVSGFAREALTAVREIPYGETASYGEVAAMAGRPRAHRAVGTACRDTPFALVVPVHRVVRADGRLGEYGGFPEHKRFLVELERDASRREAEGARP